ASSGCGSAFSAQDNAVDADELPSTPLEASTEVDDHHDAPAVAHEDASSIDALMDSGSEMPVGIDAAKDQAAEASIPCAGTGGPPGVRVGTYCIDATEVTNQQYAVFLSKQEATMESQLAICAWNTTYVPTHDWPVAAGRDNWPVGWVDWCDAYAFC